MPDECKNESTADRRDFLKLVGVAGAAISSLSLSEAASDGRWWRTGISLPKDRCHAGVARVGKIVTWLVNRRSIFKRQPISIILIQSRKTIRLSQ